MTIEAADWDMTAYFPSFGGEEYRRFLQDLSSDVDGLCAALPALGSIDPSHFEDWEAWLLRLEAVVARNRHLASYLGCLGAADARS